MKLRDPWYHRILILCMLSFCLAVLLGGGCWLFASPPEARSAPLVLELKIDREVEPILAAYIDEGLAEAARQPATLVLITKPNGSTPITRLSTIAAMATRPATGSSRMIACQLRQRPRHRLRESEGSSCCGSKRRD